MTENPQTKDSYLEGRRLESVARKQNSPGAWLKFAAVKAAKGSYALAAMGFLNSGILAEAGGGAPAAASYERGLAVCLKGGLKEVALILVSRLAALRERAGDFSGAAAAFFSGADLGFSAGACANSAPAQSAAANAIKSFFINPPNLRTA